MSNEENMSKWTLKEKKCLLATLQNLGYKNITVLKSKLPERSVEEIEAICNKYELLAKIKKEEKKRDQPSIDPWIEIFHNIRNENFSHLDITARVLKYVGLFGTNDNTEPDDPMIKKCYIWLAQAAQGHEPDLIDDCSSWLLEQCLMHLMRATRIKNKEATQYVNNLYAVPIQKSVENPSINPLEIPTEDLKIEEGEIKDLFDGC